MNISCSPATINDRRDALACRAAFHRITPPPPDDDAETLAKMLRVLRERPAAARALAALLRRAEGRAGHG